MNPKPISETESIRSDIEMTRRRMNDTIDALGERVHGRHLLDEVIGFFRNNDSGNETSSRVREKVSASAGQISASAGTAARAVAKTVKKNPLPLLLIAAGGAWLAYSLSRRNAHVDDETEDSARYDPDTHYDRPLDYPDAPTSSENEPPQGMTDEAGSAFGQLRDKASAAKDQVKQTLSDLSDSAKDTFQSVSDRACEIGSRVRDRASELGSQMQDRTREAYGKTRDTLVRTADEHPLELGLGCLAVGVLVGLALPTPEPVNRAAGPAIERLRHRTRDAGRDVLEKGRRVMQAATNAARQEAESQGLTMDRLRNGGRAAAKRADEAANDTARAEGIRAGDAGSERAGADPADPSAARPAM